MTGEFIEATAASRAKAALAYAVALGAGYGLIELAMPRFFAFVRTLPACDQGRWILGSFDAVLGVIMLCGIAGVVSARRMLEAEQWPLPGTWVLRRTEIKRGAPVRRRGYVMLLASLAIIVLPIWPLYLVEHWFERNRARLCATHTAAAPGPGIQSSSFHSFILE